MGRSYRGTGWQASFEAWARWSLALLLGFFSATQAAAQIRRPPGLIEVRRTTDGIPHVRAQSFRDLGYGVGYIQAQDALCTLAEAFLTYRGQRSLHFGADARPTFPSTFGQPTNLELDFFFRAFADDAVVLQYRRHLPTEVNELIDGFAAGYNRYLADLRAASSRVSRPGCFHARWVQGIDSEDVLRRLYAAQVAAGYARFIPEIVNAQPRAKAAARWLGGQDDLRDRLAQQVGQQVGLGSNALAFGRLATGEESAVLLGNPHWYWSGPDRFYQMHLTVPDQLNVAGVAFLGIPLVMIGFNEHVAWSHTVSEARRFGLYELRLDASDPTRYLVDGTPEQMQARTVTVQVLGADGKPYAVTRTLYRTRFGPVVDLGAYDAAFGWGTERALVIRDVNDENYRVFRTFFSWSQARSLDEFVAIQRREVAMPWVNTIAIGRGDGRVWYGDIGAVPYVPDALRAECSASLSPAFAALDPHVPLLDGTRARCTWQVDASAMQPGAMPASSLPGVLRDDYVANMNNSYWLTNVFQPLEGYAAVLGGERKTLSLRARLGHRIALALLDSKSGSARTLSQRLMQETLSARVHSAELFKQELLEAACRRPGVEVAAGAGPGGSGANAALAVPHLSRACEILRRWPNTGNARDRGALLWEDLWAQLERIPERELYQVPFSSDAPLETPRALHVADARVGSALARAVEGLQGKGWALDAALGSQRYLLREGKRLPLFGGCHEAGYFTVACNQDGSYPLGGRSHANSYLQVVHFARRGVEAHTLLAHGQKETALQGEGSAPVVRYAQKRWLRFPFTEVEIAGDPNLLRSVLRP